MSKENHSPSIDAGSSVTMFGGKGGVGKTTCAGATALHYASLGKKTLIISTDPTPSLSHIFETKNEQKPVEVLENLYLNELGLEEVKNMWNRKFGREVYEVFSSFVSVDYEEFVEFFTSIMPGISDEFMVDYIRDLSKSGGYEKIIWDTAPLGQTLGLLKTPTMLREHLKPAPRIYSKLKLAKGSKKPVLDIIRGWERLSNEDVRFLKERVEFVVVTIPEALAIQQLEEIFGEFGKSRFNVYRLIINNIVKGSDSEFLHIKMGQQREYIELLHARYKDLEIIELPLFPYEIKGIKRLKEVEKVLFG